MHKFSVRDLTLAAMVAALYAVMSYFGNIFGMTYFGIQFRFAEALTVLPFLFPATVPGLFVGCFIANILSPFGALDVVFGSLATLLAAFLTM
ncbi:MAG: QueT transporter family protein, partial [Oscillospiraceae bacterium]